MADQVSEQDIFDSALQPDEPQAAPAPETQEQAAAPATDDQGQPRDELGRFAPTQQEQAAQAAEQGQTQPAPVQPAATEEPAPQAGPPPGVLEERRRRQDEQAQRQATAQENEALKRQLAELTGKVSAFETLQRAQQQPQPQAQPQEPQQAPDFLENPGGFVQHQLNPFMQQTSQSLQGMREGFSRMIATRDHGKEAVSAAYSELERHAQQNPVVARADWVRVMNSDHPYEELVQWHKQRQTMAEVGDDPNAWFEKQLEARLADPAFQQTIAGKLAPATQQPAPAGQGRPSAPIINLIPSVTRAPGSALTPASSTPQTEDEIYAAAPPRMGRRG